MFCMFINNAKLLGSQRFFYGAILNEVRPWKSAGDFRDINKMNFF